MHEQPRSRDSHGHERSFIGGLASDGKVTGFGHSDDEKKGKKGLSGRKGKGRREIGKKKKEKKNLLKKIPK